MGAVVTKAANGVGGVVGNLFGAPFRAFLGASCQDVCAGPWDVMCFVEHLCVSDVVKLVMILGLCYITLLFLYLLFKIGIWQCIGRSLCKMCWAACESYWSGLEYMSCFLWHKLKNTKRGHRRRRRGCGDIERGWGWGWGCSESDEVMSFGRKVGYPCSRHGVRLKKVSRVSQRLKKTKNHRANPGMLKRRRLR
ncbi:uncharacterized protein LOC8259945 isoform X2 [Ricinus communis]|uniref:Transmembrane protein n=2 Tax=Ricinus communis TaxID=3988 RepID=B9RHT5_RICCO|nr:uncharacterized protein LOC8259945 isoform X2 [Ricinus communis]XP_048228587.1 uncharacterized protein LOC8259945 isoform X2 [Ricinus communis]EEF48707.1 conserved hypothetical protein [Ricinus communis]|eukprot:XP_015571196.1 uncharacterized protein LOC8259945 isoform X2 [Ricinus communis]